MVDTAEPNWPFDKAISHYKIVVGKSEKPYFLGEGAFGKVVLGWDTKNHRKVAVKILDKAKVLSNQKSQEQLKREIELMKAVKCENIVELYDAIETDNSFYMVIEYCDNVLDNHKASLDTLDKKYSIIIDVIKGFIALSQQNIIHRDIKPQNVLILNGIAKIADFGYARVKEGDPVLAQEMTRVGNPIHMAPQILAGDDFSAKCDVYSVGVLSFFLLFNAYPWNGENLGKLYQNIVSKPLIIPDEPKIDGDLKTLLASMLAPEEENRVAWPDVFNSNFVKSRI